MTIDRPVARLRRPAAVSSGAALGFVLLTLLVATHLRPVTRTDQAVSDAARRYALTHPVWRAVMSVVTHTADTAPELLLALLVVALLVWRGRWSDLVFLLAAATVATVVRLTVLSLVHRPRPVDRLTATSGWAYPSGHTTTSAVTAGVLIVIVAGVRTDRRARVAVAVVAGAWAVLVGVSRVALVAHWPTDVLGGWLLVLAVIFGVLAITGRGAVPIHARRLSGSAQGEPREAAQPGKDAVDRERGQRAGLEVAGEEPDGEVRGDT